MSILYYSPGTTSSTTDDKVLNGLREKLTGYDLFVWPECPDKEAVTTAIAWQPPSDFFDGLTNLNSILSVAAGVDHLMSHPSLPNGVDIVRLTDAGMAEPMAQYILYGALHAQRQMTALAQAQRDKQWRHDIQPLNVEQFHVGILGAGELSLVAANRLLINGFKVSCWSRTPKELDGITHYTADTGLKQLLPQLDALVCLLPLTQNTYGLLNNAVFEQLPKGAYLINPGRGGHVNEPALLEALNNDHLSGALLDVFSEEPLPNSNALWSHPNVIVTPHVAAPTDAAGAVEQLVQSVHQLESGERPRGLVDRGTGY